MKLFNISLVLLLSCGLFVALCLGFIPGGVSPQVLASSLAAPWADADIGAVGTPGSASVTGGGVFSINGSGADIYYSADAFHYVYQPLNGDGSIVARVLSIQNTSTWAKSGVMIRETLSPGSAQADVVVSPAKGVVFQRRTATGGGSTSTAGPSATAPWWVKLTRSANTFTAYQSQDGANWSVIGSDTITMSASVLVGLAVTAHNNAALCASSLDNVSVNSAAGPPAGSPTVLLADDFSSASVDTGKWVPGSLFSGLTDTGVPIGTPNQQLTIGPLMQNASGSHYNGIRSVSSYNFAGAYCYVEVKLPPAAATLADAMFTIGYDGNNFYRMFIEGGNLVLQKKIQGAKTILLTTPYDGTNFKFLRIRHDSTTGNAVFETAPDSAGSPGTWVANYSEPWNTSWVPVGAIQFELKAGTWQPESGAPGSVVFDNFMAAVSPGGPPLLQTPTVTITAAPTSGPAPLAVNFQSSAASPNGSIQSYAWDFGDGATSNQASPSHTYQAAGSYSARLSVTDQMSQTAAATVAISASNPVSSGSVEVKVMQCNIQWGNGTDNVYNLDRQATYMVQNAPDILSLNEVPTYANQAQQFASLLTQKTGAAWNFYFTAITPGNNVGQCILTRWPVLSTNSFYMDGSRSVAQATINVSGKLINFFSTHLDPDSSATRQMQVSELTTWASSFAEPRIVVGDFNSWPGGAEISLMTQSYFDSWVQAVNAGEAVSYPDNPVDPINTRTRRARIDYVFYSIGAAVRLIEARVPDTRNLAQTPVELLGTLDDKGVRPSDHNWYTASFQIQ